MTILRLRKQLSFMLFPAEMQGNLQLLICSSCALLQMIFANRRTGGAKHFRRMYDKKVNALGMVSVLTVPDESLPPEVAAGLQQLLAGLIKLLTSLRSQQVNYSFLSSQSLANTEFVLLVVHQPGTVNLICWL